MRAAIPSRERLRNRSVSRVSCPNALTTRSAPSVSCTTASAELSSFFACRDCLRKRGRKARDRKNSGGERSEEHTSELQSPCNLVCRLLLEKKKITYIHRAYCSI